MVEGFYEEERDAPFYYASLVRSIDPAIHARVQKEVPHCFKKAAVGYTGPSVVSSDKGPIMVLPLEKAWFLFKTEDLEPLVREWYQLYKENPPSELPHAERIHFLEIIRELAPGLYDLIKKVDSTGAEHIGRHETKTGAYVFCASDGLPKFEIGSDVKDMPRAWQRFIFAHELAHYVKKHLVRKDRCNHFLPQLNSDETDKDDHSLSFGHLLDQAASRINEYEADRFAVLGLGAQPEEGIAWRRGRMSLQEKKSGITAESVKKGFNSSHPHDIARIKHLRGLKREVELQKAHGKNDFSLDWEELQRFYQELQAALSGPGASA